MSKRYFFNGLAAGFLSGLAAFFYAHIYTGVVDISYPGLISPLSIFSACIFAATLIAVCSYVLEIVLKRPRVSALIIVAGTLATMVIPLIISLPLSFERPELFPGLVIPMQFFPSLAWFATKPFFRI